VTQAEHSTRQESEIAMGGLSDVEVIPINALFDPSNVKPREKTTTHPLDLIEAADVILGHDLKSQRECLVYGQEALQRIAFGDSPKHARVVKIGIDQNGDDIRRLCELVQVVKGSHDYDASTI
jgi:hypothetical protein